MTGLRILVYPHAMEIGGSQLNAIELAAAVRDLGHEVAVISEEGPLLARVQELGLEHLPLAAYRRRPSPKVANYLRTLIRQRHLDIVHGYEWPPGLEAAASVFPQRSAAAVCTVMSMAVAPFLPASMPLVVGTRALQRHTATQRPGPVHLIEPPVDVVENQPGVSTMEFRDRFDLRDEPGLLNVMVVCRLVPELKLEGILTAIDVIGGIARNRPIRLVIVGDGTARDTVAARAEQANQYAGRRAVVLTGELFDPRPAYASADIMLGMGGSALRSLAFGKPLVVQGERGFWALLTPQSCELFLQQGWYGVGEGSGGAQQLLAALTPLLDDPELRSTLGSYGRELAVERFSLQRAAKVQAEIYHQALAMRHTAGGPVSWAAEGTISAAGLTAHKLRQRYRRMRGTAARDDFNAVTLAQSSIKNG